MAERRAGRFSWIFQPSLWPASVILAFLGLLGADTQAWATNVSGVISTNTTWTVAGSPYVVTGTVYVYGTPTTMVTLTIQSGVEVRFNAATSLYVGNGANKGTLNTLGTAGSPVVFTSNQATHTAGYWAAVRFESGSAGTSLLQYTTIEYGGSTAANGSVYLNGGSPTLQNCTIRNGNGNGIQVSSGGLTLSSVTTAATGGTYSISMPLTTSVTTTGTHAFDKPIELRSGSIQSDTTWRKLGAPYVLNATSYIYKDAATPSTLTVEAGVEVRFASGAVLHVSWSGSKGILSASGTAPGPIVFTSNQVTHTPGYWGGVQVNAWSAGTSLQYTTIEYAGSVPANGSLYVNGGLPTLQNCTVRNGNGNGIYVGSASGGGLTLSSVTTSGTGGTYSISMPLTTPVTTTGSHSFDKPIELRSGQIQVDTTWKYLGAPYVLSATSYIYKDAVTASTLTVEAGVEVRFTSSASLHVSWSGLKGTLRTLGTVAAGVLFTSNQVTKTPGYWGSVQIHPPASGTSLLQYTTIEYGGYGSSFGSVYVDASSPTLQNCTIRHSSADGVKVIGAATPVLRGNNFTNNAVSALNNTGSAAVDARASWWAHASGPSGIAPGAGQKITGNVQYSPWLEAAQSPAPVATSAQISSFLFNTTDQSTTLTADLSQTVDWTLTIENESSATVMTYTGSGLSLNQSWNGEQTGTSEKVPAGLYTLRVAATSGGSSMAPLLGKVSVTSNTAPVAVITSPVSDGVLPGGATVGIYGTAGDVNDFVSYRLEYGVGASPSTWFTITNPGEITTPVAVGRLLNWTTPATANALHTLRLTVRDATSPPTVVSRPFRLMTIYGPLGTPSPWFSPNGDGVSDTFTVTATLSLPANWTLTFQDSSGNTVRTFAGAGATSVNQVWDGKNAAGVDAPDGTYTYTLAAVEPGSGVAAIPFIGTIKIDRLPPTAVISAPANGATLFDTVTITGTATDPVNFSTYTLDYGDGPAPATWTTIVTTSVQVNGGTLATWITNSFIDQILVTNGTKTIRLRASDTAGNVATAQVTVTMDNMLISGVSRTPTTIRPLDAETSTVTFTTDQTATLTVRILPETAPLKIYPDQTPETGALRTFSLGSRPGGLQTVVWDGKNDAGNIVPEEAYTYVIEARAPSGRFDKFNRYVQLQTTYSITNASIPSGEAVCDAWKNTFFSHDFGVTGGPARGSTRVFDSPTNGQVFNYRPQYQKVWLAGPNTFSWDCRDANGGIVSVPVVLAWIGTVHEPFRGIQSNYILVQGPLLRIPGASVLSDPYRIYLAYGQVAHIQYELLDDATVTVTIRDPAGAQTTLLNGEAQAAGLHEVVWDGSGGAGLLVPTEGHFMFTISATNPASGMTITRRGNLTIYR